MKKSIHICDWPVKFGHHGRTPKDFQGKSLLGAKENSKLFNEIMKFNSQVWKKKKDSGKNLRDEIKIKIPKSLEKYKKDLVAMHNIV